MNTSVSRITCQSDGTWDVNVHEIRPYCQGRCAELTVYEYINPKINIYFPRAGVCLLRASHTCATQAANHEES